MTVADVGANIFDICLFAFIVFIIIVVHRKRQSDPEFRARWDNMVDTLTSGSVNSQVVCPHCGQSGHIRTKHVRRKKGISGGKATAALLTGGVSMLGTGLSRKESRTQMHCGNCNMRWDAGDIPILMDTVRSRRRKVAAADSASPAEIPVADLSVAGEPRKQEALHDEEFLSEEEFQAEKIQMPQTEAIQATQTPRALAPAGWYSDAERPDGYRWWDGTAWGVRDTEFPPSSP